MFSWVVPRFVKVTTINSKQIWFKCWSAFQPCYHQRISWILRLSDWLVASSSDILWKPYYCSRYLNDPSSSLPDQENIKREGEYYKELYLERSQQSRVSILWSLPLALQKPFCCLNSNEMIWPIIIRKTINWKSCFRRGKNGSTTPLVKGSYHPPFPKSNPRNK